MRVFLAILAVLSLSACAALPAAKAMFPPGTNVAANTQVGQTNHQTVGVTHTEEFQIKGSTASQITQESLKNSVKADSVEHVTVHQGVPWRVFWWVVSILLFHVVAFWYLDSPRTLWAKFQIWRKDRETERQRRSDNAERYFSFM